MTVCVATMANNGVLVFAADRMLTRGVTQTEPNNAKIYHFDGPPPVTVMWAGASTVFAEVIQACIEATRKKPDRCKTISDYVSLYCDSFAEYLGKRAERTVLTRLGLTNDLHDGTWTPPSRHARRSAALRWDAAASSARPGMRGL